MFARELIFGEKVRNLTFTEVVGVELLLQLLLGCALHLLLVLALQLGIEVGLGQHLLVLVPFLAVVGLQRLGDLPAVAGEVHSRHIAEFSSGLALGELTGSYGSSLLGQFGFLRE